MRRYRRSEEEPTVAKSIVIFGLIFILFFSTSITLTSYPQHLALNNKTVIQAVKFLDNSTAIIKGNQVQYGAGDVLPLQGRDFIRITGNQVQLGSTNYNEGIRVVGTSWHQNLIFSQKIGTFKSSQTAQIIIDKSSFSFTPLQSGFLSVTVSDISKSNRNNEQHYNIQFTQETVYINENDIMIRLVKKDDVVTASLMGLKKYTNIIMRVI